MTTSPWHIGVIGGSGLHEGLGLDEAQEILRHGRRPIVVDRF